MVSDVGKLAILIIGLVGGFAVLITGLVRGDEGAMTVGAGLAGTVIGYVTGNGVLARTGQAPSPMWAPRPEQIHLPPELPAPPSSTTEDDPR